MAPAMKALTLSLGAATYLWSICIVSWDYTLAPFIYVAMGANAFAFLLCFGGALSNALQFAGFLIAVTVAGALVLTPYLNAEPFMSQTSALHLLVHFVISISIVTISVFGGVYVLRRRISGRQ